MESWRWSKSEGGRWGWGGGGGRKANLCIQEITSPIQCRSKKVKKTKPLLEKENI